MSNYVRSLAHIQRGMSVDQLEKNLLNLDHDDICTHKELAKYLEIPEYELKMHADYLSRFVLPVYTIYKTRVYRLSDIRRFLQWRNMVWRAYKLERKHMGYGTLTDPIFSNNTETNLIEQGENQ